MKIDNRNPECVIRQPVTKEALRFGTLIHAGYGCEVTFMYVGFNRKLVPAEPGWSPGNGRFPGMKPGYTFLQITGKALRGESKDYESIVQPVKQSAKLFSSEAHIPDWAAPAPRSRTKGRTKP